MDQEPNRRWDLHFLNAFTMARSSFSEDSWDSPDTSPPSYQHSPNTQVYSHHSPPRNVTGNSPPWTAEHQAAFERIKDLVLGADCLTVINYEDTASNICVTTDASDCHTGAVLSFGTTWETAHPVAYDSYQLNDAEKNNPVLCSPNNL